MTAPARIKSSNCPPPHRRNDRQARFSGSRLNRDGYGRSLQDGTVFGDVNSNFVRGALRWLSAENVTVNFIGDWTRTRQGSAMNSLVYADPGPMSLTGAFNFFVTPTNSVEGFGDGVPYDSRFMTPGFFTNYSTAESGIELDVSGLTAIVDWRPVSLYDAPR